MSRSSLALLICITLTGCIAATFRDQSADPRYREVIGKIFVLKAEFKVYGVRLDLRSRNADYHKMLPSEGPGVGGPEIMDYGRLPAGSRLRVSGVLKQTLPLSSTPIYVVEILEPAEKKFESLKIRINNARAFGLYSGGKYQGGAHKLTEKWFDELEPDSQQ